MSRALAWALAVIPVGAVVAAYGEFSPQAMAAVLTAGVVVAAVALVRRAGAGAPRVGPAGWPWLGWLVAASLWEAFVFLQREQLPTLSDLLDPVLANPAGRLTATGIWLAIGFWLLARPTNRRDAT